MWLCEIATVICNRVGMCLLVDILINCTKLPMRCRMSESTGILLDVSQILDRTELSKVIPTQKLMLDLSLLLFFITHRFILFPYVLIRYVPKHPAVLASPPLFWYLVVCFVIAIALNYYWYACEEHFDFFFFFILTVFSMFAFFFPFTFAFRMWFFFIFTDFFFFFHSYLLYPRCSTFSGFSRLLRQSWDAQQGNRRRLFKAVRLLDKVLPPMKLFAIWTVVFFLRWCLFSWRLQEIIPSQGK